MNAAGSPSAHLALADKADAVCRMGALMLSAGTGSFRVKAAMGRVAVALGVDRLDAQVSLNEIVATARAEGTGLARTTTLASGGKVCDFRYKQGRATTQGWDLA